MNIPRRIKHAARLIDRHFLQPRRRAKLMHVLGVEDMATKFDVARKRHRPSEKARKTIGKRLHERLAREVGLRHG